MASATTRAQAVHNAPMSAELPREAIVEHLRERLPGLLAVHAFGSRIRGASTADSDLDLAVYATSHLAPVALWSVAQELADHLGTDVDLLDLSAATTVMQYQVITTGERWWVASSDADVWEAAVLSQKTALDEARAGTVRDALSRGVVHGR
jgi:predicted nucleotidyltransferase